MSEITQVWKADVSDYVAGVERIIKAQKEVANQVKLITAHEEKSSAAATAALGKTTDAIIAEKKELEKLVVERKKANDTTTDKELQKAIEESKKRVQELTDQLKEHQKVIEVNKKKIEELTAKIEEMGRVKIPEVQVQSFDEYLSEIDNIVAGQKNLSAEQQAASAKYQLQIKKNVEAIKSEQTEVKRLEQLIKMSVGVEAKKTLQNEIDKSKLKIQQLAAETVITENKLRALSETGTKSAKNLKSSFGGITTQLRGIAAAAGIAFGAHQLISFTKEAVNLAAKAEGVKRAFDNLNKPRLLDNLREATKGTVTDLSLMTAAVKAENFKVPLEKLAGFFEFARNRAADTGESVDDLVSAIINGIGRKSSLVLDNLGISATELQAEIKKTGDFGQAAANIIERELAKTGDQALTTADKIAKINVAFENIKVSIGEALIESFAPIEKSIGNLNSDVSELSDTWNELLGTTDETKKEFTLPAPVLSVSHDGNQMSSLYGIGQINTNRSGNMVAFSENSESKVYLYNFDRCTGVLTYNKQFEFNRNGYSGAGYGCAFDFSGTHLYTTGNLYLIRWNIATSVYDSISQAGWTYNYGQLELMPDSNVYLARLGMKYLSRLSGTTFTDEAVKAYSPNLITCRFGLTNVINAYHLPVVCGGVLPIELLEFKGSNKGSFNLLEWSTATEKDNDYFTLEKYYPNTISAPEGWREIHREKGAGNSHIAISYNYKDYELMPENYYTLKQTDFDGTVAVHPKIVAIKLPNKDRKIIQVIDILGRKMFPKEITEEKLNSLDPGVYIVQYENGFKKIMK